MNAERGHGERRHPRPVEAQQRRLAEGGDHVELFTALTRQQIQRRQFLADFGHSTCACFGIAKTI